MTSLRGGVIASYHKFFRHLRKEKGRIAYLQLCSRLEDFLVKQFVYFIYEHYKGSIVALMNVGKKRQKKIDICLLKGATPDELEIYGMIEAKYVRNKHKFFGGDARDETATTLRDLHYQLSARIGATHGRFPVKLRGRRKDIYGLVFASYVSEANKRPSSSDIRQFYKHVGTKAKDLLRYYDLEKPQLGRSVYENFKVVLLGDSYFVTLWAGLWRRK